MNTEYTNICNTVITCFRDYSISSDGEVERAVKGIPPINPLVTQTPLVAQMVEAAFADLDKPPSKDVFDHYQLFAVLSKKTLIPDINKLIYKYLVKVVDENNNKVKSFFKIGPRLLPIEYDEIKPILLGKYYNLAKREHTEAEQAFVNELVNVTFLRAVEVFNNDEYKIVGNGIVIYAQKNLSGGGGCEDYGGYVDCYPETVSRFDEAFRVMVSSAILYVRSLHRKI